MKRDDTDVSEDNDPPRPDPSKIDRATISIAVLMSVGFVCGLLLVLISGIHS